LAVQANQLAEAGYTKKQIAEELTYSWFDDVSGGAVDVVNKAADAAILKVEDFSEDAYNRAFAPYLEIDPETEEFDGRVGLRQTIGDREFDRKFDSGEVFRLGDSTGGLFNGLFNALFGHE